MKGICTLSTVIRIEATTHSIFAISMRTCLLTSFGLVAWATIVCYSSLAQSIQFTHNVADLSMRSDIHVDPSTLSMSLQIPLRQYPGRGGANFTATLSYSSKVWRINHVDTSLQGLFLRTREEALFAEHSAAGWTSSLDPPSIENTGGNQVFDEFGNPICLDVKCKQPKARWYISRLHVHMPDGSSHELRKDDLPRENSPDQTGSYFAVDGSQLRYDYDTSTLYLPDGSRYIFGQTTTQYIDRNGNTLTYNISARRWTDSLGRLIPLPLPANPTSGDVTYTVPGVDGSSVSYIFRWKTLSQARSDPDEPLQYAGDRTWGNPAGTLSPSLFASEFYDYICTTVLFNPVVLSEIELPNGRKYVFTYNVWGEIDKVIYPTGGYEEFVYATIPALSSITGVYNEGNRGVVNRLVSVDGLTELPNSQYSVTGAGGYTVNITAPDGTRTERVLHHGAGANMQFGFDEARAGRAKEERVKSGGQTTIRRKLTEWMISGPTQGGWNTATRDPRPIKTVEIMLDYGNNDALARTSKYNYDPDLNRDRTRQYAFTTVSHNAGLNNSIGQFSDGTLMLKEETTYLVNDGSISQTVRDEYRERNLIALPTLTVLRKDETTRVAETQMRYDEIAYPLLTYSPVPPQWIDPATGYRGNVTTVRRWLDMPDSYIETHTQYDQTGNVRKSYDALDDSGVEPRRIWETEYSSTFAYAYPTLSKTPVPQSGGAALVTLSDYDFNTGLPKTSTDPNNKLTSFEYDDPMNRLTQVVRPTGGGSTTYSYSDTPGNLHVRTQTELDSTRTLDSYQFFDGLGRANRSFNWEGGMYVVADTQYDNMGRVSRVSNPYRTTDLNDPSINPSENWTTTLYDALGRVLSVTAPASAPVTSTYFGNQVTVTDQAGKKRRSTTDALGRLTTIDELNSDSTLYAQTTYGYNALGNLLAVNQATNGRGFTYDSLSRLRSVSNPEQVDSTTYTYDLNSNLKTKLDPNSITTTYDYDNLNRIKMRTYTEGTIATPEVTYIYDSATNGKGRLSSVAAAGVSTYNYTAYDAMGRVTECNQAMIGGSTYMMSASYNLAGLMVDETYPSTKVIHTEYDDAGRVAGVKNAANTNYYAGALASDSDNRIQYAEHGAVSVMKLGNGKWEHTDFNSRLQPTLIGLGVTGTDSSLLKLEYTYGASTNNGNVLTQKITAPKTQAGNLVLTQTYSYDSLNRLLTASEDGSPSWTQTYDIDRCGNRAVRSGSYIPTANIGLTPLSANSTDFSAFNQATNRLSNTIQAQSSVQYDDAGNLTRDAAGRTMAYDAENRLVNFNSGAGQYSYDGDGRRVKKIDTSGTTIFVYSVAGQLISEYTSGTPSGSGTSYLTTDHLGSTRVVMKSDGTVKARYDYLPFGEEIEPSKGGRSGVTGYGGADSTRQKFTQKERDVESGLDYFGSRYYSSPQGRFTSVDPITVTPPRMVDPQQLNLYAYVRNNPLAYIDPTGMIIDVSHLSKDDLKKWKRIEQLANRKDDKGNYVNPKLRGVYERLQSDKRTFFVENHSFGDRSATIGETNITKHNGKDDFTEAVIQIDFKKAKNLEHAVAADLVPGFNKFEGLLEQGERGVDARRAEVFGHEGSHGIWDLDNPAEAVKLQMQLADRDAALAALPIKGRYPLPPDVMQKFADADKALVPTERFAQQAEKIVNGELRASIKH